jgi:hypothetical protein
LVAFWVKISLISLVKSKNKALRIIVLLLKIAVAVVSVYILYKAFYAEDKWKTLKLWFVSDFEKTDIIWLVYVLFGAILNWSIESKKWQVTISSLEQISFSKAFETVLSAMTLSFLTPNRIGEFAARVLFIHNDLRSKALVVSAVSGFSQLLVVLVFGAILFGSYQLAEMFPYFSAKLYWILACALILLTCLAYLNLDKIQYLLPQAFKKEKWLAFLEGFSYLKQKTLVIMFLISIGRYFVFLLQYYFIMRAFNVEIGFLNAIISVSILLFVQVVIPSFAFSEFAVRGAYAVLIFSFFGINQIHSVIISYAIWMINILLPALVGGIIFLIKKPDDLDLDM